MALTPAQTAALVAAASSSLRARTNRISNMAGYGDDAGFTAWLTDYGYQLPTDPTPPSAAVLRNRGSNYIDAVYGSRFLGSVVDAAQERQWPREGAIVNGKLLPSNVV